MGLGFDRHLIAPILAVLAASTCLAFVQPRLAKQAARVKETSDVYPLPPVEQLPLFTLGYDAAAADALWAHILVVQGLRMQQNRRFDHGSQYFESLLALDPTFRDPYLYVDAILTFGSLRASYEDCLATRRILERGVAARPRDAEIAYQAGSFMAYIAPSYLRSEEEIQAWERDGAAHLARAAELGASDPRIAQVSLSGASLLSKRGQRDAAISMLERAFAVATDEGIRLQIVAHLRAWKVEETADGARAHVRRLEEAWGDDLPFVSLSKQITVGPPVDPFACAGARSRDRRRCERTWKARLDER